MTLILSFDCRCESCHGQAERLLDSAREMEDSIAVNLRSVYVSISVICQLYQNQLSVSPVAFVNETVEKKRKKTNEYF